MEGATGDSGDACSTGDLEVWREGEKEVWKAPQAMAAMPVAPGT